MHRKKRAAVLLAVPALILAAVIGGACFFIFSNYVVLNWQLYPKGEAVLDLREQALSPGEYRVLSEKLPDTEILWSIPFQGGYYTSDTQELTVFSLTDEDIDLLQYFPMLKTVRARQCNDYPQLQKAQSRYPGISFDYVIRACEQEIAPDAASISITELTEADIENLGFLTNLKHVDGMFCRDYDNMRTLQRYHPEWIVTYRTTIAGTPIDPNTELYEAAHAEYDELSIGLAAMPKLKKVILHNPEADGEELEALRLDYPDVDIRWEVTLFDTTIWDDAEEVDFSAGPIGSIDVAKEVASKFPHIQKLIVESTGIDNEEMAAYREEMRSSYKVVWTVYFTQLCKARTDETYFMPIKQGEYYFQEKHVAPLKYCEDMVCIDLGHSTIQQCEFAAYMPHLKYLILAHTFITDITPLSNCKELVYLEIDWTAVSDFSPLLGCTALEDVNINETYPDVGPLTEMTWLKNLWAPGRGYTTQQRLIAALPDTHLHFTRGSTPDSAWRRLPNYYAMRDYLGMPYMD